MASLLLFLEVGFDSLSAKLLEEDGTLLESWVQLAIDKDAPLNVLMGSENKGLVFRHDSLVDSIDAFIFVSGSLGVSVHFVDHLGFAGAAGSKLLDKEEVRTMYC